MQASGVNTGKTSKIRVQYAYDDDRETKYIRVFHNWYKYIEWLNKDDGKHVLQICFHISYQEADFKDIDTRKEKEVKLKEATQLLKNYEEKQQTIW